MTLDPRGMHRTDYVMARREAGASRTQIAAELGVKTTTIGGFIRYARRRDAARAEDARINAGLRAAARARKMTVTELRRRLLLTLVSDELVDAILDDDVPADGKGSEPLTLQHGQDDGGPA